MNKNQLITILIILACNIATAQQRLSSIKGLVVDSISGKQLHKASISLSSDKANKAIRNTISKDSGFALRQIPNGEYIIIISHTGYTSVNIC